MPTIGPMEPCPPRRLGYAVAAACLVVAFSLAGAPPAGATSCAPHPDGRPAAIVSGQERLSTGKPFFATYDLAIAGTVRSVRTDRRGGSSTYGLTRVRVAVLAAFGVEAIAPTLIVPQADPGWLNGYPFRRGRTYFIPLRRAGDGGLANAFVCDPISEMTPAAAARLAAIAPPDLAVTTAGDPPLTRASADGGGSRWALGGAALAALVAAGAILAGRLRRRRR